MSTKVSPQLLAAPGTEHAHQRAFFCAISSPEFCPVSLRPPSPARLCFAIPNGGARDTITAGRLKAEGVKAGVPDCFLPVARGGWFGLFMEFKKPEREKTRNGGLSDSQVTWRQDLNEQRYCVVTTYGWYQGLGVLEWVLALPRA